MANETTPKPAEKLDARHIQTSRTNLANLVATFIAREGGKAPTDAVTEHLRQIISRDNLDLGQFVEEMILSTPDLDTQRLIASTAYVVYTSLADALDPGRMVETEGN